MAQALLQTAGDYLRHVKTLLVSSADIIDPEDEANLTSEEAYQKLGRRFLVSAQQSIALHSARDACVQAMRILRAQKVLSFPTDAMKVAISRFGVGECDEGTVLIFIRAVLNGAPACIVRGQSQQIPKRDSHQFVILGATGEELRERDAECKENLIHAMGKITKGVILDPILNLKISADRFPGSRLEKYLIARKIGYLQESSDTPVLDDDARKKLVETIEAEAAQVHALAIHILASPAWVDNPASSYLIQFVIEKRFENFKQDFPKYAWKKNVQKRSIWAEGTLNEMTALCELLKEKGIEIRPVRKANSETAYVAMLDRSQLIRFRRADLELA